MIIESIVPQSAGSLSVAVMALMMTILQIILTLRKPKFTWFAWSAAISFSCMVYAVSIFFEYNTLGTVNRFSGLMEFAAIIVVIHCMYGFTFSYLGINSKPYHILGGFFHLLILINLWSGNYIVADRFAARNFIGLSQPFIEPELGSMGIIFEIYAILACFAIIIIWLKHGRSSLGHRTPFIIGISIWIALGIHDALASIGVAAFQYLMEYGFLIFSLLILWVVFEDFVDISADDKYRVITEYANDSIIVIQNKKPVFANPACNELIGGIVINIPPDEFLDLIVPDDRQRFIKHCKDIMCSGYSPDLYIFRIKINQKEKIVEMKETHIVYNNKPALLVVMRDITKITKEQEEMHQKILRLKKMESLGLLAGGVAHDLNNVLTGIVSYPDLILLDLPPGEDKLRKSIQILQDAGQRAAAIVQDLLTMARGVAVPKKPINLNDVIKGYLRTPEYKKLLQYHPSVTIKDDLASDLLNINGSSVHIGKIIMNLLSNACESMGAGGNIFISTMNRYIDRPLKGYDDVNIGEYAVLLVKDKGPGIADDDLKRIFEPFFTKKVMGRSGTGLGLTVVWNIVQDHDGYIDVSTGDDGTKFELYFPITRESLQENTLSVPIRNLYGNGETILVIDDIDSQRKILCQMLDALNYTTKSVSGGDEAVKYIKEYSADLLILDMIMDPGINGCETYKRIKEINPEQKAIIVSGFAETEEVKKTMGMGAGQFLKKPITLESLGISVKKELSR